MRWTKTDKGSKKVIHKAITLFIILFIVGQITVISLIHYKLIQTPEFLGYTTVETLTYEPQGYPPSDVLFDKVPNGTFFVLKAVFVHDCSIYDYLNATELWYDNISDKEFNWLVKHAIIIIWSACYGFTYDANNNNYFYYNGTLEEYIEGINKIRSKVTYIDKVDLHITVILQGWVNDSTFDDVNLTDITSRFNKIALVFGEYMWRNEYKAFEEISGAVYTLIVIDILILVIMKIKAVKNASINVRKVKKKEEI